MEESTKIDKEYCSYAHEGNCTKEFLHYDKLLQENDKLKQKLEKIKEFINKYGPMQSEADCGLPVGILQIIESEG